MADKAKDLESSMREQQEGTAPSPSTMGKSSIDLEATRVISNAIGLDKATVEAQAAADGQGKKNKRKRKHKKKKSKKNKAAESNDQAQNDPVPAPEQVLVGDPHLAHLPRFTLPEDIGRYTFRVPSFPTSATTGYKPRQLTIRPRFGVASRKPHD